MSMPPHSSSQPGGPTPDLQELAPAAEAMPTVASPVLPTPGEVITSGLTGCTYTIGEPIGQGSFGIVYACVDDWNNLLAAKVLKPTKPPQEMQAAALAEMNKPSNSVILRLLTSTMPLSFGRPVTSSLSDAKSLSRNCSPSNGLKAPYGHQR